VRGFEQYIDFIVDTNDVTVGVYYGLNENDSLEVIMQIIIIIVTNY